MVSTRACPRTAERPGLNPPPQRSPAPPPRSPFRRIPSTGDLLAIWNNNLGKDRPGNVGRTPLTAAISKDEGETWEQLRNIEERPGDAWAYPAVTWVDDRALVTYFNYSGGHSLQLKILPASWFYGR